VYHNYTSSEGASRRGQPLNIFTWFIGAGGYPKWFIYIWYLHDLTLIDVASAWLIYIPETTHTYVVPAWRHKKDPCLSPIPWQNRVWLAFCNSPAAAPVRRDLFICVTWLIHMYYVIYVYATWRNRVWLAFCSSSAAAPVLRDSFIRATWLIHMCDRTHSYVRHDSFICATWLIHMCEMTHSYVRHDSFICAT